MMAAKVSLIYSTEAQTFDKKKMTILIVKVAYKWPINLSFFALFRFFFSYTADLFKVLVFQSTTELDEQVIFTS